jgi:hypothetical protein
VGRLLERGEPELDLVDPVAEQLQLSLIAEPLLGSATQPR